MAGQPVLGSTLQEGGLELQLTLLNATTMQPLSDVHKPAKTRGEGLLAETKSNKKVRLELPLTVRLTGSCHTFKFFVLLLSSDIKALIKIKVSRPNADAGDPLCVVTRAFRSRARSNLHEVGSKRQRSPDNGGLLEYQDLCAGGDDGPPQFTSCSADADEGPPPCFRSLGGDDDEVPLATGRGEDEGDAESEYEHEEENEEEAREREVANALARTRSQTIIDQAHAVDELQMLLSALKTGGELPTGATLCLLLQRNTGRNSRC